MALSEGDISWQILRQVVQDWAGTGAELREFQTLDGGSISTTLALTLANGHRSVLKITPHRVDRGYADEALQLKLMKECGLPVPEVYACQVGSLDKPFSYILMEFVEGVDLNAARSRCSPEQFDAIQCHLAELLLKLHEKTAAHFMRVTAAEPKKFEKWPACYRDIFEPIWREVEKSGLLPVKTRKTIAKVYDRLDVLLAHDDVPRLVHWDVWATNLLTRCGEAGNWQICACSTRTASTPMPRWSWPIWSCSTPRRLHSSRRTSKGGAFRRSTIAFASRCTSFSRCSITCGCSARNTSRRWRGRWRR